jgi:hypothetical protein
MANGTTDEIFVEPLLKLLKHDKPAVRALAAAVLGQFHASHEQIIPRLEEKLGDPDSSVIGQCVDSIGRLFQNPIDAGVRFRKIENDNLVMGAIDRLTSNLDYYINPTESGGGPESGLNPPASFPWPPPRYSAVGIFGQDFPRELLGDDSATVGTVYKKIYGALTACDPKFVTGLFGVKGGFALMAEMERVDADGQPAPGRYHFVTGWYPPTSLSDYISRLFLEKPGYFRLIVFAVTDEANAHPGEENLPPIKNGVGHTLDELGTSSLPFKGRQCYALIYSFEKKPGSSTIEPASVPLSAKVHLGKVGFLAALTAH